MGFMVPTTPRGNNMMTPTASESDNSFHRIPPGLLSQSEYLIIHSGLSLS